MKSIKKNIIKISTIGFILILIIIYIVFCEYECKSYSSIEMVEQVNINIPMDIVTTPLIEDITYSNINNTTFVINQNEIQTDKLVESITTTKNSLVKTSDFLKTMTTNIEEYIIYKPSTHYIHKNNCHWSNIGEVIKIENTEGIEARKCSECNPDMEIIVEYIEPEISINNYNLSNSDINLLRKIVSSEYGSDWVSIEEKAKIVASVMNQVNDSRYPDTILDCLNQSCTPWGFNPYGDYYISDSIIEAVDYYFQNKDTVFAD